MRPPRPRWLLVLTAALLGCAGPQAPAPTAPEVAPPAPAGGEIRREYEAIARANPCPEGYPSIQGRWRFAGETRTPGFRDELTIQGTRFDEALTGTPEGQRVEGRVEGEIRCLFRNRVLVLVDRVTPEGAFDNRSGEAYPCDVLEATDRPRERVMLVCYFDWDLSTAAGREFEYERLADE